MCCSTAATHTITTRRNRAAANSSALKVQHASLDSAHFPQVVQPICKCQCEYGASRKALRYVDSPLRGPHALLDSHGYGVEPDRGQLVRGPVSSVFSGHAGSSHYPGLILLQVRALPSDQGQLTAACNRSVRLAIYTHSAVPAVQAVPESIHVAVP